MVNYRRNFIEGGTYFFTVTLFNRSLSLLTDFSGELRESFKACKIKYPFKIDAIVVLPEHLHCILTLPENDCNYSGRWKFIKSHFTRQLRALNVELKKDQHGQYNLWQRRFWEHTIRDERDFQNHINYIHYNPIKHGYVDDLNNWALSSFDLATLNRTLNFI
ncbi:MAG: hypothetical protein COB38_13115 [Gammaproteobacteria bacterium]|nr:MAG: hypothetical protein COB38_13115 [Gammaproteobacteria bacterium]